MFYDAGCYGHVLLGELPAEVRKRLSELPGDWLEFDPPAKAIVVRHCQPCSAPCLPTIAGELVRALSEVPAGYQGGIPGGSLYVHTESDGQLVRLQVEPGGSLRICWAHPDYSRAQRSPYTERLERLVDPRVQRLNGCLSFVSASPCEAAREVERLADTFEGLYPEGEFIVSADEREGVVQMRMADLNLDVRLLMDRVQTLAREGSLQGRIEVSSFAAAAPEQHARFLFDEAGIWIQRPVLWEEPGGEGEPARSTAA